ncbi:unnamed protein product [Phytophthora lilii]|uniref:Unnamed protein product n=1 Tax=Phytophthora lilii TaxID=2077276 RepID=A0A9W6WEI7_9STRA|nr:unnamed protein product [Phytophthora lilii]
MGRQQQPASSFHGNGRRERERAGGRRRHRDRGQDRAVHAHAGGQHGRAQVRGAAHGHEAGGPAGRAAAAGSAPGAHDGRRQLLPAPPAHQRCVPSLRCVGAEVVDSPLTPSVAAPFSGVAGPDDVETLSSFQSLGLNLIARCVAAAIA